MDFFKMREIYNLVEEDLLRMKRKAQTVEDRVFLRKMARGKSLFITVTEQDSFMIHPHSRLRLAWDMTALICLLYDLITVPMLAFQIPENTTSTVISFLTCVF